MKTRKLVSLGLAAVMSLSLAAPIFAADDEPANSQTVFTSTYSAPDIKVTVPQAGTVALNPLGLDIAFAEGDATQTIKGQQIVTTPVVITNNSLMDLSVSATVTTAVTGATPLKLTKTQEALIGKGKETDADYLSPKTDKSAFVFFQMMPYSVTGEVDQEKVNQAAAKWEYDYTESADSDGTVTPKAGCLILDATKAVKGENLVTLNKAEDDGTPKKYSSALMRLSGKMVQSPAKAENAWKEDDQIVATVAFTFTIADAPVTDPVTPPAG